MAWETAVPLSERIDRALERLGGIEALAIDPQAARGLYVLDVVPGSQAEAAGVDAGWVILSLNGVPLSDKEQEWQRSEVAGDRFEFQRPDGQVVEFVAEPGLVGVRYLSHRRSELWYLRHGNRDARWDLAVVVASALAEEQPSLALAAWDAAFAAGYKPDDFSHACRFTSLAMLARHAEANHLWQEHLKHGADANPIPDFWPGAYEEAAVAQAAGDVPWLAAVEQRYRSLREERAGGMDDLVEKHAGDHAWLPLSDGQRRVPANADIRAAFYGQFPAGRFRDIQIGEPFRWSSAPGNFRRACFKIAALNQGEGRAQFGRGEPLGDFLWEAHFTVVPNGQPHHVWHNFLNFTVYDSAVDPGDDNANHWHGPNALVGLGIRHSSDTHPDIQIRVSNLGGVFHQAWPEFRMDPQTTHAMQIARVGEHVDVWLDGKRVALMPLPGGVGEPVFLLHSVGLRVHFEGMNLFRLEPEAVLALR